MPRPVHIVIPVKGGATAKSRLAPALGQARRLELADALAAHVIATACAVASARSVTVVTSCTRTAEAAYGLGATVLTDRRNAGTAAACLQALDHFGSDVAILFINADLPFLHADVIERMATLEGRVVIAPDRRRIGTNALLLPANSTVRPCFGEQSFIRHQAAAEAGGVAVDIFDDPAIAHDVDEPADLDALGTWRGGEPIWERDAHELRRA